MRLSGVPGADGTLGGSGPPNSLCRAIKVDAFGSDRADGKAEGVASAGGGFRLRMLWLKPPYRVERL